MEIKIITKDKKQFLDLLLLADEQESMVDRYLGRGTVFALYDGDLKSICVVTQEAPGVLELKNLATYEKYQRQGYGRKLILFLFEYYQGAGKIMYVGTGESPATLPFYQKCGFSFSHRVKDYFTDNYDHPIWDGGVLLTDMIYLKKEF